jgi:hypothetical protein
MRWRDARTGKEHRGQTVDEVVQLFGYHRKAAIQALRPRKEATARLVSGGPREYDSERLPLPLKAIRLVALPCSVRFEACLQDWLQTGKEDHRRLDPDVRESLFGAS